MRRLTALSLLVLLSLQLTGCYHWVPTPAVAAPERSKVDDKYRVTLASGRIAEVANAHVRGDSLLGSIDTTMMVQDEAVTVGTAFGAPLAQVTRLERRESNGTANALIAVGVTVAVVVEGARAISSLGGGSSSSPSTPICLLGAPRPDGTCGNSCPLIYSWDGVAWHLDSGTFGGAITPALARTDLDNLLFPRPELGLLQFRMTDEANETEHVDAFNVLAIDHPAGTDVAPDARANSTYHLIADLHAPIAARDFMDRDVLDLVRAPDARTWESEAAGRDPNNPAHLRDGLELTFVGPARNRQLQLVVDAQNTEWAAGLMGDMVSAFGRLTAPWYDPASSTAASAPMARAQHAEGFLQVTVWDGATWQPRGEIWEAGPEVAKRQVLPLDLTGIAGDTIKVRLESAPSFWHIDYVGLGPLVNTPVTVRELPTVSVKAPRDTSAFAHLAARDGAYLDMERGDEVSIIVRDTAVAALPGMVRSYLGRTSGWYRIHGRDDGAPDVATLMALAEVPHGAARLAVTRMNQALAAAAKVEAPRVPQH